MPILTENFNKLDGAAPSVKDIGYVTFTVEQMRSSSAGTATIVESKVTVALVNGVMTTPNMDPGPVNVRVGSGGKTYRIHIPTSSTPVRLWPLIDAAAQPPPNPAGFVRTDGRVARIEPTTADAYAALGDALDPATLYVVFPPLS